MPVLTLASRYGRSALGAGVSIRTVASPAASTDETTSGVNAPGGASALSTCRSERTTASAVRSVPSWNVTPSRSVNSQAVGSVCRQSVASIGFSSSVWSS
jgi:hypothetical protein